MNRSNAVASYKAAKAAIQQLVQSGVQYLVASPGFRNSPLLLAAHQNAKIKVISAVDERAAGFLALGLSKSSGSPAALLCTSGTAVANYFPAVMESSLSGVPLIVLTADRPQELVGTGANQCTDQTKVFGSHVRFFADTSPASEDSGSANHLAYLVGKAVSRAQSPSAGPVHLNIRFKEPFLPNVDEQNLIDGEESLPWKFIPSATGPSQEQSEALEAMLRSAERPLIVLGPVSLRQHSLKQLASFSRRTGVPIVAETASGFGFTGSVANEVNIQCADALLHSMAEKKISQPDLLIRFGAPLTGKGLTKLLKSASIPQVVFEPWGEAREPDLHPSIFIEGGLEEWISSMEGWDVRSPGSEWIGSLLKFQRLYEEALTRHLEKNSGFSEWHFHSHFEKKAGEGSQIFLGNSMPIRDFNSAFSRSQKEISVHANRGLSGIDGLIASAVGVALGTGKETHAILGDLSTLHDLSSLSLLSSLRNEINLTLWVMNNGGGEIFRIVPTSKASAHTEWFTTPQQFDLSSLSKGFQIPFDRIVTLEDFLSLDPSLFAQRGVRIVELLFEKEFNLSVRTNFRFEA